MNDIVMISKNIEKKFNDFISGGRILLFEVPGDSEKQHWHTRLQNHAVQRFLKFMQTKRILT